MLKSTMRHLFLTIAAGLLVFAGNAAASGITRGTVKSADGVEIVYVITGSGADAVLFIHGGFADSNFWSNELKSFADRYRVVALDMAGHGRSGRDRDPWTVAAFGEDVRAVVDDLGLKRVVLIGNSMGGPVALEAARIMPDRVVAVIGIDTLNDATQTMPADQMEAYIQAWHRDYKGTCAFMVKSLFHEDGDPELMEEVRHRMCDTEPPVPADIMECFKDYDLGKAMAAVDVPVRSLNGDLYPVNIEGNRKYADYDAVIMKDTGHYPMLENPAEFDRLLAEMLIEVGLPGR